MSDWLWIEVRAIEEVERHGHLDAAYGVRVGFDAKPPKAGLRELWNGAR